MADSSSSQDKNLPASQRKLEKAREEGQVVRSRDLGHFAAVATGVGVMVAAAPQVTGWLKDGLASALRFDASTLANTGSMGERLGVAAMQLLWVVLPLGALIMVIASLSAVLAGGWNWTTKAIAPQFSRLNPITGLPRLLSKQQLTDALKSCLLALVLGTIGSFYLKSNLDGFAATLGLSLPAALSAVGDQLLGGVGLLVLALFAFALIDVPLQRFLHASRLKMSHQEMKEEFKQLEGNQEVKVKMKARMREMVKRRMLAEVPQASLVVMNPTHYAVALKYDETMSAPRVVAKGADLLAMKIRDVAKGAQVPVLQAPVLARALYAHAELGREIPATLFSAVAQVLAYVFQLRAAMSGKAPMPGELPELLVPAELDPHNDARKKAAVEAQAAEEG
jgi:flagellar biosynthetic protein FlhB